MAHPVTSLLPSGGLFPVRHDPASGRFLPTGQGGGVPRAQQRAERKAARGGDGGGSSSLTLHHRAPTIDEVFAGPDTKADPGFALVDDADIEGVTKTADKGHTFDTPAPARVHPDLAAAITSTNRRGWSQEYEDRATGAVQYTNDHGNGGVVMVGRAGDDGVSSVALAWVHFAEPGKGYEDRIGPKLGWADSGSVSIIAPNATDAVKFVEDQLAQPEDRS